MEKVNLVAKEAAEYLGISYFTLVRYATFGELPAAKIGSKWIFSRHALDQWLANGGTAKN